MDYQIDSNFTDDDEARVDAGFARHAEEKIGASRKDHDWVMRDGQGLCIAYLGLVVVGHESYIKTLWVDDVLRGEGLAKDLMVRAESFARTKQHSQIWVDTLSFQAPEFYKKLGYKLVAEVPNYSAGHARVFLNKILLGGPDEH